MSIFFFFHNPFPSSGEEYKFTASTSPRAVEFLVKLSFLQDTKLIYPRRTWKCINITYNIVGYATWCCRQHDGCKNIGLAAEIKKQPFPERTYRAKKPHDTP